MRYPEARSLLSDDAPFSDRETRVFMMMMTTPPTHPTPQLVTLDMLSRWRWKAGTLSASCASSQHPQPRLPTCFIYVSPDDSPSPGHLSLLCLSDPRIDAHAAASPASSVDMASMKRLEDSGIPSSRHQTGHRRLRFVTASKSSERSLDFHTAQNVSTWLSLSSPQLSMQCP